MPRWSINLLLILAVCGVALALTTRPLERALTFYPTRSDPAKPWPLPVATQQLTFETSDGVRLHGWLLRSQQTPGRGALLYLHGNAGNLEGWFDDLAFYRQANFDLFMIDYRGYGKSTGHIQSETQLHADVRAAWNAVAPEYAGRKRVIYGRSLGTGFATRLASEVDADLLVLVAPYSSVRDVALATGFSTLAEFSRAFKQKFGKPPSHARIGIA